MSLDWGPHFIVPSEAIKEYFGHVLLREQLDETLLAKELRNLNISGLIAKVTNPWYFRKKGEDTWIKIGESEAMEDNSQCPGTQLAWIMVSMRFWDSCMCS